MKKELIPKEVILHNFNGLMALSPCIYQEIVNFLAKEYSVDPIELAEYIIVILQEDAEANPINWDDF